MGYKISVEIKHCLLKNSLQIFLFFEIIGRRYIFFESCKLFGKLYKCRQKIERECHDENHVRQDSRI